jgi:hypothetical protein
MARTLTGAINQELGRIAGVQHHYINAHYGKQRYYNRNSNRSIFDKPLEFDQWFLKGIRFYESKGYEFEFLTDELIRIIRPGKNNLLRTKTDFKREHEEYLSTY